MSEIKIVRTIKPKKGDYICEGTGEYIGKHPYQGDTGFFTGIKTVWQRNWFSTYDGLLVLPDFCLGVSYLTDDKTKSEIRWSSFLGSSPSRRAAVVHGGALGGLLAGSISAAFSKTKNMQGFVVFYMNDSQSTGGFIAAAEPKIVEEIFSVMPQDKIIPI